MSSPTRKLIFLSKLLLARIVDQWHQFIQRYIRNDAFDVTKFPRPKSDHYALFGNLEEISLARYLLLNHGGDGWRITTDLIGVSVRNVRFTDAQNWALLPYSLIIATKLTGTQRLIADKTGWLIVQSSANPALNSLYVHSLLIGKITGNFQYIGPYEAI